VKAEANLQLEQLREDKKRAQKEAKEARANEIAKKRAEAKKLREEKRAKRAEKEKMRPILKKQRDDERKARKDALKAERQIKKDEAKATAKERKAALKAEQDRIKAERKNLQEDKDKVNARRERNKKIRDKVKQFQQEFLSKFTPEKSAELQELVTIAQTSTGSTRAQAVKRLGQVVADIRGVEPSLGANPWESVWTSNLLFNLGTNVVNITGNLASPVRGVAIDIATGNPKKAARFARGWLSAIFSKQSANELVYGVLIVTGKLSYP